MTVVVLSLKSLWEKRCGKSAVGKALWEKRCGSLLKHGWPFFGILEEPYLMPEKWIIIWFPVFTYMDFILTFAA